ncbi:MAG: ATP-dependent protease ATPase subunit HslU [Acidobacteriota bacterium]
MVHYMPGATDPDAPPAAPSRTVPADALTPAEVVAELDRHVVGQGAAKRALALALRSRLRRQSVGSELRDEITPRNLLLIGPTGVGKTELARRLAKLTASPFVKVEASKFTEVGYVGRDVESLVRDLVARAVQLVQEEQEAKSRESASEAAERRLLEVLAPLTPGEAPESVKERRQELLPQLRAGELDDRQVEIELSNQKPPGISIFQGQGMEPVEFNLPGALGKAFGGRGPERRKTTVGQARELLLEDELAGRLDEDAVNREACERAESSGIVFLDEIDKVAGREGARGPDVSREGVQRDLLPIVEGCTVQTKWGTVRTDHVLFIAAGAFHVSKPSDLIPELQGRFPVRVELTSLGKDELLRILKEPAASLTQQTKALLATEGVALSFQDEALEILADYAVKLNSTTEDIGARRLHAMLEKLIEDLSFTADQQAGEHVEIDAALVHEKLGSIVSNEDHSRYVL